MSDFQKNLFSLNGGGDDFSVQVKVLDVGLREYPLFSYGTPNAAAMDLRAMFPENPSQNMERGRAITRVVKPGETTKVSSGMALYLKNPNLCAMILPRSGLGTKGLVLANGTGLIDSDYQGEISIMLFNRGKESIEISRGDRVAQMVFLPVFHPKFQVVDEFDEDTLRGQGGFGSTGVS